MPPPNADAGDYAATLIIEDSAPSPPKTPNRCSLTPIVIACVVITIVGAAGFKTGKYIERTSTLSSTATGTLAANMNMHVSPCDDMWAYTCGSFVSTRQSGNVLYEYGTGIENAMRRNATVGTTQADIFYQMCIKEPPSVNTSSTAMDLWKRGRSALNITFLKGAQLDEGIHNAILIGGDPDTIDRVDVYTLADESDACTALLAHVVGRADFVATNAKSGLHKLCEELLNKSAVSVPVIIDRASCWRNTVEVFPRQVSATYIAERPVTIASDVVTAMAEQIREIFVATLEAGHFTELASKIQSIAVRMGDAIEPEHYPDYDDRMTFSENLARLEMEQFRGKMQFFPEVYVNAFYLPSENVIHITHAMLEYVVATGGDSLPLMYGKLGFVIAHEMAHSIDPAGVHFSTGGDYSRNQTIFGTNENENKFLGDTTCLEKEYGTNGRTTNEDVADFIGMKVMIKVMEELTREPGARICKEGACTEMTAMQLFYIGFAQMWCKADDTPGLAASHDVHSGGKVRTEHILNSANAQYTTFGCKENHFNTCSVLGF